jgi:4-amino-4-deoxy-L-arabinose transferase-like glycosyltransferase
LPPPSILRRAADSAHRRGLAIPGLILLAFAVRFAVRLADGEDKFWGNSYSAYYEMALNFTRGQGMCIDRLGWKCAYWPPIYPLLLAATTLAGWSYWPIVALQAAVGAGTVWCSCQLGKALFNHRTGLVAGVFTAFYPYYVVHDTALQETSTVTLFTAAAVLCLVLAKQHASTRSSALAGLLLGLATLTRASLAAYAVLAFVWLLCCVGPTHRQRVRSLVTALLPFGLLVGLWLIRTQIVVGVPLLSSQSGRFLWIGNNPYTFSHYPSQSIDVSELEAWRALAPSERAEIERLSGQEAEQGSWFARKGLDYIRDQPLLILQNAARKLAVAFSCALSPSRDALVQTIHSLAYCPILALAAIGAWLGRRQWRAQSPIFLVFLSFAGVTALFWAHTSHRSPFDLYLQVYAAYALTSTAPTLQRALGRRWMFVTRP